MSYSALEKEFSDVCESLELLDEYHGGWYPIVKTVLETAKKLNVNISLIKEKFGTLRVCCHISNDKFIAITSFADDLSMNTCSKCGKLGQLRINSGWYVTGCATCFLGCPIVKINM